MAKDHAKKEPLHQHDEEALPADDERSRRIMQLRRAIQAGTYDEDESLKHLLGNLGGLGSDKQEAEPDPERP